MLELLSAFYCQTLKTNPDLERAVLTGCLEASRESPFADLDKLKICFLLDTSRDGISQGIGFTPRKPRKS